MTPGYHNGVIVYPISTDRTALAGFYVENSNTDEMMEYADKIRKEVDPATSEDEAREELVPRRNEVIEMGYTVGPIEVKSHKEWCVDVFGTDPDEYDEAQAREDEIEVVDAVECDEQDYDPDYEERE